MNSPDPRIQAEPGLDPLGWRLKSWVDRQPSPEAGRQRLLAAAGEVPNPRRRQWELIYARLIRPLLPNRAAMPFSAEDLISSVTMFSALHAGCVICT